jgi:uncharacterized membrane protein YesL
MQKTVSRPPSVRIAFRTFGRTLRHSYENLGALGIASALWWLLALPLVTLGPASAALHRVTQPMTEERATAARRFWEHFRADWGWSSLLVWTMLLGLLLWDINRRFYGSVGGSALLILSGLFLVLGLIWIAMLLFALPLALRQADRRLRTTVRNAAVLVLANLPGVIVSLILLFITSLVLLIIPPLFIVVPGWIALWTEENVRLLLVESNIIPADEFADSPRRRRG